MFGNVAIPPTAATVTVPPMVDVPGFVPIASVTLPVKVVASPATASRACTMIAGAFDAPASAVVGPVVNSNVAAGPPAPPAVAVALIVSGEPASPADVAVIVCAPSVAPSVHDVET